MRVLKKYLTGDDSEEGPPVPIPNTEVKLLSAENTCWATDREDRTLPVLTESEADASLLSRLKKVKKTKYSSIAQSVEHAAVNRRVVGSSPT